MTPTEFFASALSLVIATGFYFLVRSYLKLEKQHVELQQEMSLEKTKNSKFWDAYYYREADLSELERKFDIIQKDIKKVREKFRQEL